MSACLSVYHTACLSLCLACRVCCCAYCSRFVFAWLCLHARVAGVRTVRGVCTCDICVCFVCTMFSLSCRQLYLLICGCLHFFGLFFELSSLCRRASLSITPSVCLCVRHMYVVCGPASMCITPCVCLCVWHSVSVDVRTVRVFAIRQMCVLCIGIAGVLYITSLSLGFSMFVFSDFSTPASCLLEADCVSSCVSLHVLSSACVSTCFSVCHLRDL